MLLTLLNLATANLARNAMETAILIFNKKYNDYMLAVGPQDIIMQDQKEVIMIPFTEESMPQSKLVLHQDSVGHAVLKDFERKYRSVVSGGTIKLSNDLNALSDMWIKKIRDDKDTVFRIISHNQCLTATEDQNSNKTIGFEPCENKDE